MNVDSLFSNPIIKNVAMGTLKKALKNNNITLATISLDADGELHFEFYSELMAVITESDLNAYKQQFLNNL